MTSIILRGDYPVKTIPKVSFRNWESEDIRLFEAIKAIDNIEDKSLSAIAIAIKDRGHLRKGLHRFPKTKSELIKLGKIQP